MVRIDLPGEFMIQPHAYVLYTEKNMVGDQIVTCKKKGAWTWILANVVYPFLFSKTPNPFTLETVLSVLSQPTKRKEAPLWDENHVELSSILSRIRVEKFIKHHPEQANRFFTLFSTALPGFPKTYKRYLSLANEAEETILPRIQKLLDAQKELPLVENEDQHPLCISLIALRTLRESLLLMRSATGAHVPKEERAYHFSRHVRKMVAQCFPSLLHNIALFQRSIQQNEPEIEARFGKEKVVHIRSWVETVATFAKEASV